MTPNKKYIKIGGVETFSAVDFPGKMSAAIFMQGCPWRCPFCYNDHLQPYDSQNEFVWEKFVEFLEKRKGILDAVVFSGGEPLVQDALEDAIKEVKAMGYTIGLHTGGFRPALLEKILPMLSWVGFDIKAPFDEVRYAKAIGLSPSNHLTSMLKSLDMIIASGINFECRTTCDPRILSIEDIYTIADSLKQKGVKSFHLQKYRPISSDKTTESWQCDQFFDDDKLKEYLISSFDKVEFRM